jgi:hypothetical protein
VETIKNVLMGLGAGWVIVLLLDWLYPNWFMLFTKGEHK